MKLISTKLIQKLLVTSLCLAAVACGNNPQSNTISPSAETEGVVYGGNSMKEIDNDAKVRMNLASVAAIFDNKDISINAGKVVFNDTTVEEKFGICPGFKLNQQISPAHCTGTLVGRNVILTAKHCVNMDLSCADMSVVFGFEFKTINGNGKQSNIPAKNVYKCQAIQLDKNVDAARIILDRNVSYDIPLVRQGVLTDKPGAIVGRMVRRLQALVS
ncbi:MAG: trypsin-like serine protease, partial [Bdellovibrionota bacterium]